MKILKQKILFLLYFVQSFSIFAGLKKETKYLSYNFLYLLLSGFVSASVRKAVGELVKEDKIDKIVRNRKVFLRLTVLGETRIRGILANFFYQQIKARGWFLGVIRDKEDVRQIRQNLKRLGFIKLAKRVYLLPAKRDFAKNLEDLIGKVFFIFTQKLEFFDEKQLVGQLWQVDWHYKESEDFVIRAKKVLSKVTGKKRLSKKEIKALSSLSDKFFVLIKNTIGLPKNLLPEDWPLLEAAKLFGKILEKVE